MPTSSDLPYTSDREHTLKRAHTFADRLVEKKSLKYNLEDKEDLRSFVRQRVERTYALYRSSMACSYKTYVYQAVQLAILDYIGSGGNRDTFGAGAATMQAHARILSAQEAAPNATLDDLFNSLKIPKRSRTSHGKLLLLTRPFAPAAIPARGQYDDKLELDVLAEHRDPAQGPEAVLDYMELESVLNALIPADREVLLLYAVYGIQSVMDKYGSSRTAAKLRVYRAQQKARTALLQQKFI